MVGESDDTAQRRHPGVELVPAVVEGRAGEVLVEASRGADLLAIGSRGHGEVAGLFLGSVDGAWPPVPTAPCWCARLRLRGYGRLRSPGDTHPRASTKR